MSTNSEKNYNKSSGEVSWCMCETPQLQEPQKLM